VFRAPHRKCVFVPNTATSCLFGLCACVTCVLCFSETASMVVACLDVVACVVFWVCVVMFRRRIHASVTFNHENFASATQYAVRVHGALRAPVLVFVRGAWCHR